MPFAARLRNLFRMSARRMTRQVCASRPHSRCACPSVSCRPGISRYSPSIRRSIGDSLFRASSLRTFSIVRVNMISDQASGSPPGVSRILNFGQFQPGGHDSGFRDETLQINVKTDSRAAPVRRRAAKAVQQSSWLFVVPLEPTGSSNPIHCHTSSSPSPGRHSRPVSSRDR